MGSDFSHMANILIIVRIQEERVFRVARSLSRQFLDRGNDVELYGFNDAPFGVNLNQYDGIVLGCSENSFIGTTDLQSWIEENLELLKKMESAFYMIQTAYIFSDHGLKNTAPLRVDQVANWVPNHSVLFCVPDDDEPVAEFDDVTFKFSEVFARSVESRSTCGMTFQSSFKREYLHNGIKLGFR